MEAQYLRQNISNRRGLTDITQILESIERGDPKAADELLPLVYLSYANSHRPGWPAKRPATRSSPLHSFMRHGCAWWGTRTGSLTAGPIFFAAAEAMRRILIENARRKRASRHGGGQQRVEFERAELAYPTEDAQLLAVNEALDKLAGLNKLEAELVKLRYLVGMTLEESAAVLGVSPGTADNYWAHARAWLFRELKVKNS